MDIKLSVIIILALLFIPAYFVFAQTPAICGELEYSTLREGSFSCEKINADSRTVDVVNTIDPRAPECPLGVRKVTIVNKKLIPECNNVSQACSNSEYYGGFAEEQVQCISASSKSHYGKSCAKNQILRGVNEDSSLDCVDISIDLFCPNKQYLAGAKPESEKLYMVGSGSNSLYVLDTEATDRSPATRIGRNFTTSNGQPYASPRSITSHHERLYMIDTYRNSFLRLITNPGDNNLPGLRVGNFFSDMAYQPESITSHNGELYMIGSGRDALFVLNTEALISYFIDAEGPATRIGTTFEDVEDAPISITSHNGKLYMVGSGSASLYELNTEAPGNPATIVGMTFEDMEDTPTSITSHNGKLYMVGSGSASLYELNTEAPGNPATIVGMTFEDMEDTPTSITSHNGKLYMVGSGSASLYELNTEAPGNPATIVGMTFEDMEGSPESIASYSTGRGIEPICKNLSRLDS